MAEKGAPPHVDIDVVQTGGGRTLKITVWQGQVGHYGTSLVVSKRVPEAEDLGDPERLVSFALDTLYEAVYHR